MKTPPLDISKALLLALADSGMSGSELARRAQIPQPNISLWKAGKKDLRGSSLSRIAAAIGYRVDVRGNLNRSEFHI